MHEFSRQTLDLVNNHNYLDRLQVIYGHEEGERNITQATLDSIRAAYRAGDNIALLDKLLGLEKFPYKDSYVGFLRKDRQALYRNSQTVQRICDRLYAMGEDGVILGVTQAKEANQRRGNQFGAWARTTFNSLPLDEFANSTNGIVMLDSNEAVALDFCNTRLRLGISKRPDFVGKSGSRYVVGEAKFLSSTGGNQGRAFDDGMHLATLTTGNAYKIFILDGIHWIERGSEQYGRIDNSSSPIFSALLLEQYLAGIS